MGGIPLLNLGAMPALPSPATGIVKTNPLTQLGQEIGRIPAEMNAAQQDNQKTALGQEQLDAIKRKTVEDRYDRNIQLVKNNPALKSNKALINAITADAKTLKVVPPLTDPKNVAGSSATAIPASPTAGATPPGGAAPGGGAAAPAQEGGLGAPLNLPATPAGAPAVQQTPPAGAPMGGGPGGMPAGAPADGGREIDMEAIAPHPGFSAFATPANIKEAYALTPEQRQAAYPPSFFSPADPPPAAFYSAKKTWGTEDTQKLGYAKAMMQSTIKSGDKDSVFAAIKLIAPMFKDDPSFDPGALIDPGTFQNIGQVEHQKLDILRQANVIKDNDYKLKSKKIDADLQMMHTREGLMQLTMQADRIKNQYLPQMQQKRIENMTSQITARAAATQHATDTLNQTIANNKLTDLGRDKANVIRERGQLITQQDAIRNEVRGLLAAGQDDVPDPTDPTKSLVATLSQKIVTIQDLIDKSKDATTKADDPNVRKKAITDALPHATDAGTPKATIDAAVEYYKTLPPADRKTYLARPNVPADVKKRLLMVP